MNAQILINCGTNLQAEPYNQHDKNSIICFIENVQSKIDGNCSLEKAGHIRATAAAIIREAKPKKMSFEAKLVRLNYDSVVLSLEV